MICKWDEKGENGKDLIYNLFALLFLYFLKLYYCIVWIDIYKLTETDYLALSDNTLSDDMRTYRQELRDLPEGKDTVEKCENATFPTKP